jgi:hypothetical protein
MSDLKGFSLLKISNIHEEKHCAFGQGFLVSEGGISAGFLASRAIICSMSALAAVAPNEALTFSILVALNADVKAHGPIVWR